MVVLRPTQKLQHLLPTSNMVEAVSDTALGDWYVNRFVVDRRPLLLLLSSRGLLPIVIPARDVRALPKYLPALVAGRLQRLEVAPGLIAAELAAMAPVQIAKTLDRSVLGVMVDFAKVIPFHLEIDGWDETTLPEIEFRLAQTPCYSSKRSDAVIWPEKDAPDLLAARWHAT